MDRKEEINKEIDSLETRIGALIKEREDIIKKRKSSLCWRLFCKTSHDW